MVALTFSRLQKEDSEDWWEGGGEEGEDWWEEVDGWWKEGGGCFRATDGEKDVVVDGLGDSIEPVACPVAGEEEAAGVSRGGVATDWTVAGWWGPVEGLAASPDCRQCCVVICFARLFIPISSRAEIIFSQLASVSLSSQAVMASMLRLAVVGLESMFSRTCVSTPR